MNGAVWSIDDMKALRRLAATGLPAVRIAAAMGRTESAVRTRAHKSGTTLGDGNRRSWSSEEHRILVETVSTASSVREVAKALGRSRASIQMRMFRNGLRLTVPTATRERIVYLASSGWSPSRIARQVGVPVAVVERHAARGGA